MIEDIKQKYSEIYLMGFSQGALMSLYLALNYEFKAVMVTGGIFFPFLKNVSIKNQILAYCGD